MTSRAVSDSSALTLNGAGSTFDQPFFTLGFYEYHQKIDPSVTVNYASIGSGGGQGQIEANTVNFGATDVPMFSSDLAKATAGTIVQVPIDLGGEAISYNVKGLPQGLHLTGPVLAEIYLGQIANWDNSALKKLNPKVNFPNESITVVHRADGSGTSYAFTNYLADISSTWQSKVGVGKTVAWPVGVGGQGNEGVAGLVADTPGSIGYVELDYALKNHFTYFAMRNPMGAFVLPSKASVAADAALHPGVSPTNFKIDNLGHSKAAYPICTYSWLAIYQKQTNASAGTAMVDLFEWMTHGGQKYAGELDYVPLPSVVQATAEQALSTIVGPSGQKLLTKAAIAKYGVPSGK
ncbi:MAG TPA: phosphate ABC transporter substrate-binding protein PstS [Acidimicrobiales bacterium]|nr:phosphate ABC transporter substrate-binding protein PstS [Acidimicrobiales bacterium]